MRHLDPGGVDADLTRMARLAREQLRRACVSFREYDLALAEHVVERDDVLDNLNLAVEEHAAAGLADGRGDPAFWRAALKVAANIERAGDAAQHIAERTRYMSGPAPDDVLWNEMEGLALAALDDSVRGFLTRDADVARRACLREPELDSAYSEIVERLEAAISRGGAAGAYLQVHSAAKYLEKIGDYALNIAEQALFLITGRRLKFGQLGSLERLISDPAPDGGFRRYWGGISGAVVASVEDVSGDRVIYKEGSRRKIAEEAERLARWAEIAPGATPRVLGTLDLRDRMALLREFVEGSLLSDILFDASVAAEEKLSLTTRLSDTLIELWTKTYRPEPAREGHVAQISARLDDVYALHPHLEPLGRSGIDRDGRPLPELLDRAQAIEDELTPPFSVWLHGDLNANNVVVTRAGALRFIDVHRSHFGDLAQDVAVFLVSCVRHGPISQDVQRAADEVRDRAAAFAAEHADSHFAQRLSLARARSLITSARVVIDPIEATRLFVSGIRELGDLAAVPS